VWRGAVRARFTPTPCRRPLGSTPPATPPPLAAPAAGRGAGRPIAARRAVRRAAASAVGVGHRAPRSDGGRWCHQFATDSDPRRSAHWRRSNSIGTGQRRRRAIACSCDAFQTSRCAAAIRRFHVIVIGLRTGRRPAGRRRPGLFDVGVVGMHVNHRGIQSRCDPKPLEWQQHSSRSGGRSEAAKREPQQVW